MVTAITKRPAANKPSGRMYLSADQHNITGSTWTLVNLDSVADGFNDGIEDTVNHRIAPGAAGYYLLTAAAMMYSFAVEMRVGAAIRISDTRWVAMAYNHVVTDKHISVVVTCLQYLTADDYADLRVHALTTSNDVDIYGRAYSTFLCLQRVR